MEEQRLEASTTCWSCQKRPPTTTYTSRSGKYSDQVCASCLEFRQMKEAFEWGIYESQKLVEAERWDDILAWLEAFEQANRHRDHTGWLARNAAAHRALVYWEAERYEESLAACEQLEQLGFEDAWHRWLAGSTKAQALEGLGRHAEALATFEEALRHADLQYIERARHSMHLLAEFAANAGQPVHERWRDVVRNVAAEYEVEFPERPTLGESILALFDLTEGKPSKREREAAR